MINVKRLGHATFETPDLERQIDYFRQVVGLSLAEREGDRAFFASNTGPLTVVLQKGPASRTTKLAFEIPRALSIADAQKHLASLGIKSEARSDSIPGVTTVLNFTDIKGTAIELFHEWSFLGGDGPAAGAAVPLKLGHLAFVVPDPKAVEAWYQKVLGFRTSDWIGDYFVFMRCGPDHHTVNFIRGPGDARMHHVAFELRDAAHMHNACDLLGRKRLEIVWGPVRHGPGHNLATYHRNPDDQLIEFFIELDRMTDEELGYFDPRPWHGDRPQKPKVWDPNQPRDKWGLPPGPNWVRQNK
jgi:catechol 2,3-dioxygenase-like lactoylglutathione lyase family enzyme